MKGEYAGIMDNLRPIIPSYVLAAACEGTRHDTEDATNWDWKACGKRDRHY